MELKEIDKKRQKKWKETDLYKVKEDTSKPKFYILDMFPYPSGAGLHVGHPKGYIATDCLTRKKILQGFNVLHPMGFDTFGLGTENYAIERKMKPQDVAKENIETFIEQLEMFGTTYDRSRSVNTADPKYFKRTQRIFLQLYNHYYDEKLEKAMPITDPSKQERLAYVDYKPINRCPSCMTGLANEDLDDGKCERCGSEVEQKPMKQRVLRITKYAERLLEGLNDLKREESMKDLERNRIGKSEGTEFEMNIDGMDERFSVYTTRIDTVFGMSFVAIAPEHPLVDKITMKECLKEVEKYKEAAKKKSQLERTELQKEKTGVFCGAYAINPFNGEKVKIFVADYVLANYGTGVVMAVPAHDQRDFEFAKKYKLPIIQSIAPLLKTTTGKDAVKDNAEMEKRETIYCILKHWKDDTYLCLDWKEHLWKGLIAGGVEENEDTTSAAIREIQEETGYEDITFVRKVGRETHNYFYASHKNINRYAVGNCLYFELKSDKQHPIDPKEDKKHDRVWIKKDEVENYLNIDNYIIFWRYFLEEKAYGEKGILMNSGDFSGMTSEEAIPAMQTRLKENKIGGVKTNYKMQDRVFSRQRYRGEPFPILRTEDEPKLEINFRNQETWKGIVDKVKTLETRVLNPEEPQRYFGDVKIGDIVKCNNKETGESLFVKITKVYHRANFEELRKENKNIIEKIYSDKDKFKKTKTIEEFKNHRDFADGYIEKAKKNGIVGWEIEVVSAQKKIIALDEKDLPLELPDVENYQPTGTEEGPLANITDRVNVTLPDGTKAKRETNTMPGRAGSSRYWLRYMDVNNEKELVGKDKEKYRGSVDVYVGGAEHITRHMIYGRFWQKFLFDIGAISHEEPFQEYHYVGLIMGEDGRKMSKRWGNVVNPDDIIGEFGADVLRTYEMFMGPFDQSIAWNTNGIKGVKKFLEKIILLKDNLSSLIKEGNHEVVEDLETKILLNQSIKKLTDDIDEFRFNTAVSQLMILVNHLTECKNISKKTFEDLVVLVSPFAPHLAEELREQLGNEYSIFTKATWPKYDAKYLIADTVTIAVQINGKVRGTLEISKEAEESEVMKLAKADEKIVGRITAEPKKVIYVKGKILNIVV